MKRLVGAASVGAALAATFFGELAPVRGQARSHTLDRSRSSGLPDSAKECLAEVSCI